MKRSDLPKNCPEDELDSLPTVTCRCNRKLPPIYPQKGTMPQLGGRQPLYPVKWVCPDPLCHGPFES